MLLRHNSSLRSVTLSDFCKEPSPGGRGGKMLEETLLDYALTHVFAQKYPAERASLKPLCIHPWETQWSDRDGFFVKKVLLAANALTAGLTSAAESLKHGSLSIDHGVCCTDPGLSTCDERPENVVAEVVCILDRSSDDHSLFVRFVCR
jgi:hypothetical protein